MPRRTQSPPPAWPCLGLVLLAGLLAGCAAGPGDTWRARIDLSPGWQRIGAAARQAAGEPRTWAPLAAAAVIGASDIDRDLSDWAREQTPLFGSTEGAGEASDRLVDTAKLAWWGTLLAAPGPSDTGDWLMDRLHGAVPGLLAIELNAFTTGTLKHATDRVRPNGTDQLSLPSGHTSSASVHAHLASAYLRPYVDAAARPWVEAGADLLAAGTGWARVEAGVHYPSDVLAGYALGRFFARWASLGFGLAGQWQAEPAVDGGWRLVWSVQY